MMKELLVAKGLKILTRSQLAQGPYSTWLMNQAFVFPGTATCRANNNMKLIRR